MIEVVEDGRGTYRACFTGCKLRLYSSTGGGIDVGRVPGRRGREAKRWRVLDDRPLAKTALDTIIPLQRRPTDFPSLLPPPLLLAGSPALVKPRAQERRARDEGTVLEILEMVDVVVLGSPRSVESDDHPTVARFFRMPSHDGKYHSLPLEWLDRKFMSEVAGAPSGFLRWNFKRGGRAFREVAYNTCVEADNPPCTLRRGQPLPCSLACPPTEGACEGGRGRR